MTFVVLGASGHTGAAVARTLLARGHAVRAVVRDPAKAGDLKVLGAEVVTADLRDASSLAKVFIGAQGAYLLSPPDVTLPDFSAFQRQVIDALVAALQRAPVPHVVFLSSSGAQFPDGTGPIAGLHYAEKELGQLSKVAVTSLRAAYFMENFGSSLGLLEQGLVTSFLPGDFSFETVATKDIGLVAVELLLEGPSAPRVVELAGPSPRSMSDVASLVGKIVGRSVDLAVAPVETTAATLQELGFSPQVAGLYQEMLGAMLSGRVAFEQGPRFVRGKTEVEEVLRGLLGK